jgi:ABC-type multidrug transport system fused ATPase/permease subunit
VVTWHAIQFDAVQFAYTPDRPALHNVSFDIPRGKNIAVVGESGSGKTTLAMLLLGFITPQAGVIRIGETPLPHLNISAWREQIAWVSQKPFLFNMSIKDNIRMGNPNASDADIIRAAQDADAHDFIMRLPAGYDTPCGERGTQLSGGQAQRVAIARAFLKNAPFLIFDEPTANLDPASEAQVMTALVRLAQGRTAFSIAHRLDTITHADMILVMRDGRLVEHGTHQTLLAQNGYYAQLRQQHA